MGIHCCQQQPEFGTRQASGKLATSNAPSVGSFTTWLAGFPAIIDPGLMLPDADADSDGRSNYLEYATGGNPSVSGDPSPCWMMPDGDNGMYVRFSRVAGVATIRYSLEISNMITPWLETAGTLEEENPTTMRLHLAVPISASSFYRLSVKPAP